MPHTTPLLRFSFDYSSLNCRVPRVPIRFIGRNDKITPVINAVLDSGADEITIPKELADWLSLNLQPKPHPVNTASGKERAFTAAADFFLGRGGREVKYKNVEICVIEKCPAILVGISPVFEDFDVKISAGERKFVLEPKK
jgi:predicted aspartyl protease